MADMPPVLLDYCLKEHGCPAVLRKYDQVSIWQRCRAALGIQLFADTFSQEREYASFARWTACCSWRSSYRR